MWNYSLSLRWTNGFEKTGSIKIDGVHVSGVENAKAFNDFFVRVFVNAVD